MFNLKILPISAILFSLTFSGTVGAKTSVTPDVKKVVDEVVSIVTNKDLKKPENKIRREQELKKAIGTIFDYDEMAKLALGRNWNGRTAAEQKEFVQLFEDVLWKAYARKVESYNNEKIVYLNETNDGKYAEVRSKVITPKGDEYSLDYRLMNKNGKWAVYDVIIEGVSLVANYRSQFDEIISDKGYDELVRKLKFSADEIKGPK